MQVNITQEDLAQINRFARSELTEEQVYKHLFRW